MVLQTFLTCLGVRVPGTVSGFFCDTDTEFLQALPSMSKMEEAIISSDFAKSTNLFLESTLMLVYRISILLQKCKKQLQRFHSHSDVVAGFLQML